MKKLVIKIISIAAVTLLCGCLLFFAFALHFPAVYRNSYQKGFVYQVRHLQEADDTKQKLIVTGGSYVTFSTDSAELTALTGIDSYIVGVHSMMGNTICFEQVLENVNPGDIVVIPMWFTVKDKGMDLIYMSLENEPDLLFDFIKKHPADFLKSFGPFTAIKIRTMVQNRLKGITGDEAQESVYDARSFDPATGNLICDRTGTYANTETVMDFYTEEGLAGTVKEVNAFTEKFKEKGAAVCLAWPPMYRPMVPQTDAELAALQEALNKDFEAPFIMNVEDSFYDYNSFFDTVPHLTTEAAKTYTAQLADDLKEAGAID